MKRWRVGRKLGRTLYRDEVCVGMVDTPEIAAEIVATMNGIVSETVTSSDVRAPRNHCNRCDRCGWPLGTTERTCACAQNNCAQRPLPPLRTHCAGCGARLEDA